MFFYVNLNGEKGRNDYPFQSPCAVTATLPLGANRDHLK